jgi:hypothetical protein
MKPDIDRRTIAGTGEPALVAANNFAHDRTGIDRRLCPGRIKEENSKDLKAK